MGEYFSEDLHSLIMGKITAKKFREIWGSVDYDAMNGIINVGENTIITNME